MEFLFFKTQIICDIKSRITIRECISKCKQNNHRRNDRRTWLSSIFLVIKLRQTIDIMLVNLSDVTVWGIKLQHYIDLLGPITGPMGPGGGGGPNGRIGPIIPGPGPPGPGPPGPMPRPGPGPIGIGPIPPIIGGGSGGGGRRLCGALWSEWGIKEVEPTDLPPGE